MTVNPSTARTRGLPSALLASALLALSACTTTDPEVEDAPFTTNQPILFALTTDYKTGGYSAYGLDSSFTMAQIEPVHSDAAVRYLGGNDIFVINRLGRDNIQVIDRHILKTVLQIPLPAKSNPHDLAIKDSLIYVAFYGTDKIGIYRQGDGSSVGEIDLSEYADSSDGLPETSDLQFIGGDLFVLTQNLDIKAFYAPLTAHVLKVDVSAKKVSKALDLSYGNPTAMTWDSSAGRIYIPCLGAYSARDGGILSIDPVAMEIADTMATEADLGGDVNGASLYKGKLIMNLGAGSADKIIAISPADGASVEIASFDAYKVGGMAVDGPSGTLFVGDRKKGEERLRIFDLETLKEKTPSKVDLGMPPSDMAIIR